MSAASKRATASANAAGGRNDVSQPSAQRAASAIARGPTAATHTGGPGRWMGSGSMRASRRPSDGEVTGSPAHSRRSASIVASSLASRSRGGGYAMPWRAQDAATSGASAPTAKRRSSRPPDR